MAHSDTYDSEKVAQLWSRVKKINKNRDKGSLRIKLKLGTIVSKTPYSMHEPQNVHVKQDIFSLIPFSMLTK